MPRLKLPSKTVLRLLFAIGALALIFWLVPIAHVMEEIRTASPIWLLVGLTLQMFSRFVTAGRMAILAKYQGLDLGYRQMLEILFASSFYALVLPGALLSGAATYAKYRQRGGAAGPSLGNVVVNKGVEVLGLGCLVAPCFMLYWGNAWLSGLTVIGVALFALFYREVAHLFGHLARRGMNARGRGKRIWQALGRLMDHLNVLERLSRKQAVNLLTIAIANQALVVTAVWVMGIAVGATVSWVDVAWVYALVYVLALLPLTIANAGVREGAMVVLLQPLGVAPATAIAWSFCLYLSPLLSAVAGAVTEAKIGPLKNRTKSDPEP